MAAAANRQASVVGEPAPVSLVDARSLRDRPSRLISLIGGCSGPTRSPLEAHGEAGTDPLGIGTGDRVLSEPTGTGSVVV